MGSPVRALKATVLAFAITGSASCGGELVRLGDGPTAGAASAAGAAGSSSAGSGGGAGESCTRGQVEADEVLWIGDTWAFFPGDQQTHLAELAVAAGALEQGEAYESLAEGATFLADIVQQYEAREAGPVPVKVLLMDGGTWDTMQNGASADIVMQVVSEFEQFLQTVASDGTVEHIVYFLMPELPAIPGVAELRSPLQTACAESSVPCYFLDLNEVWQGNPEYTDPISGFQASREGATAIAEAIWGVMQRACIAQ